MTRARNGAATVAPTRAIAWHLCGADDDRGPSRTFPPCRDGDALLARTADGRVVEVTVERRHGTQFVGPDGEHVEAEAIAERPRVSPSRSGRRRGPVLNVQLPIDAEEAARFRAAADEEGLPLAHWLVEAARAYSLMAKRPDGTLTDADWRKVVQG